MAGLHSLLILQPDLFSTKFLTARLAEVFWKWIMNGYQLCSVYTDTQNIYGNQAFVEK